MMKLKNALLILWQKKLASKIFAIFLSFFAIWMLVSPLSGSGSFNSQGDLLFDRGATFYDAGVHLSLISEMSHRFPPTNFALGGVPLKNYHYLYDAALTIVHKLTGISSLDLYYRIGPVVVASLLCLAIYLTILRLSKNHWAAAWGIFLTIFATSFGTITPLFKSILPGNPHSFSNNFYMTDQIFDMMVNPHGVLALAIFLYLFICLSFYSQYKKNRYLVLFFILLGLSFGVKAYGGVVFAAGSMATAIWFLKNKDFRPVVAILIGLTLMFTWFIWSTDRSIVGLKFAPLWFLDRFMSDFEHLYQGDFPVLTQLYLASNNWWRLAILYFQAFFIYLIGSLGIRILGLITILKVVKKPTPEVVFLLSCAAVSFVIPLFFNQSSKPYDIVQFLPYFTMTMGVAFTLLVFRQNSKPFIVLFLMILFLFLDKHELKERLNEKPVSSKIILPSSLLLATNFITTNTPAESIFLLAPTEENLGNLWFTSMANRRAVLSGEFFSLQTGVDIAPVKQKVQRVFSGQQTNINFDYLFLQSREKPFFDKIKEQYKLSLVFENESAAIYKRL